MKRLAIITSHPIQYNAPLFSLLQQRKIINIKVFYTWGETVLENKYDPGFGKTINWDIPLLDGYDYEFVNNSSKKKGSHHFNGIINPGIIGTISTWKPDAILVYGWAFNSHLKVMRYFKNKIRVFFRGDSTLLDEKRNVRGFLKTIFIKWIYTHIDKAFYAGTNNKNYFLFYGLKENQLVAAWHAIDNSRFDNKENKYAEAVSEMRKQLDIGASDWIFLYAGKLIAEKNVDSLIKAFGKINAQDVHLVIAGNGPEENSLKENYKKLDNLHFLDFQNQKGMPLLYELCDIFVLPSNGETWGLSVNEAMTAGKAVIVSDKCGCAVDLVTNEENGYIFETGNADDLYLKMKKCINHPDHLKKMKTNSYTKIQRFTLDHIAAAIEKTMIENA